MREAIEKVIAELMEKCEAVEKEEQKTSRQSGQRASLENMFCAGSAEALKWSISKLRAVIAGDESNPKSKQHAPES